MLNKKILFWILYKMNVDVESDYEEEEILIYADFKNQLAPLELNENTAVKIIGIEGEPIAEVNGNVFKGSYDYPMGTCVFFEKDLEATPSDPLFESSCRQKYKYIAKTNKVLNFERIFVENKLGESTGDLPNDEIDKTSPVKNNTVIQGKHEISSDEDNLRINMSYDESIKLFQSCEDTA